MEAVARGGTMLMRSRARACWVLTLALLSMSVAAVAGNPSAGSDKKISPETINKQIAVLKIGKAQDRAAAAYWLGQQHSAAAAAVDRLIELLGDVSEINPAKYRTTKIIQKMTVGEEVASALVNIGRPSIDPLIRVLKNSPDPEA